MQIQVNAIAGGKYYGELSIDSEKIAQTVDNRVGCVVRTLINQMQLKYGKPTAESILIDIQDW